MTDDFGSFDQDTSVINCQNGVLDLRTGLLLKHDRSFKMVNLANVAYRSTPQPTPHWERFLDDFTCHNAELKEYLLCCLGYSLTGETAEQKFFVLYGGGGNGKTTLVNIIRDLIGISTHSSDGQSTKYKRYFATLRSEAILMGEKGGDTGNDLAAISKARFVVASEIGDRKIKDERLKAMVGGDTMQVRFLFREFFEIVPHFKLWLQTNQRPRVRGNDEGIWRRAIMLPCLGDFRANPDKHLGDKLFSEREAIFHRLVQYAIKWYKDKLPEPPSIVLDETATWREETDSVARYLRERVERVVGSKVSNGEIWADWSEWCKDNNERPGTSNDFYKRIRSAGWEPRKLSFAGESKRGYENMKLLNEHDVDVEF
jgi:putative DNA primase/helicase